MAIRVWLKNQRVVYLLIAAVCVGILINGILINGILINGTVTHSTMEIFSLLSNPPSSPEPHEYDTHPISKLIQDANKQWEQYENDRSKTFRETVAKYRDRYGRHPPPGFVDWYKFARKRKVHNIDDFQQVIDDLRPFWGVEPWLLRQMAASLSDHGDGIGGIHIRNKTVAKLSHPSWRIEAIASLVTKIVKYLPDMDIAVNVQDQPRIVVPFEDIQEHLKVEEKYRQMPPAAKDNFTAPMDHLLDLNEAQGGWDEQTDPQWFAAPDNQFMNVVQTACPPESLARASNLTVEDADRLYKTQLGGFVNNFNISTDLCTVGPAIKDLHGLMFSPTTLVTSKRLLPVFSECKVSVNNDILFPASMYTLKDERYLYNSKFDYRWEDKADSLLWRGATSGGVSTEDNWQRLHRQRLVVLSNGTLNHDGEMSILFKNSQGDYELTSHFNASDFAHKYFDVGFTEIWACEPNCSFYNKVVEVKAPISLSEQFKAKFLVDVDGHSFSGRWRAFHFSKSLGIKATIFREWHDSRLFAWKHFVPLDNRYDDLYSVMTYFIGTGHPSEENTQPDQQEAYIPSHDYEAKMIASQSREWANEALRDEDIEIYMLLLLLEYGRIMDDNRDNIGYSGDGSELDSFDGL